MEISQDVQNNNCTQDVIENLFIKAFVLFGENSGNEYPFDHCLHPPPPPQKKNF